MTKKLIKLGRIALSVLLIWGWYRGFMALLDFHYTCFPELHQTPINQWLVFLPLAFFFLLMPFPVAAIVLASGYRLHRIHWFFLEITKPDQLRVRWKKKLGWNVCLLPPRTDGASPYVLYWSSVPLFFAAFAALLGVLLVICWRTPAARYLIIAFLAVLLWVFLMPVLPTRNNFLDRVLTLRKSRDLRRAWECNLHMTAAMEQGIQLQDMPEAWFLPYPAALQDQVLVRFTNFNRASRLINQQREAEGYEILRYFFDLKPTPETNMLIAGAILNGALCEALVDLPPMCLSQLDHPTLKLPLPPTWIRGRLYAEYARALFLHHDEAEAAAILPKLEAAIEKDGKDRLTLERLQRKAGLLIDGEGEKA